MLCLGHADTGVADGERLVLLVGENTDTEVLAIVEFAEVGQSFTAGSGRYGAGVISLSSWCVPRSGAGHRCRNSALRQVN